MASPTSQRDVYLEGGGLLLEFVHAGDRFEHHLIATGGARSIEMLCSLEGTPQEAWPASPPLQQIHPQATATGEPLALGVGMAGRSHWSLSARLDEQQGFVEFDVACRASESPPRLASSYRLCDGVRAEAHQRGVQLSRDGLVWQIEPSGEAGRPAAQIELLDQHITIHPTGNEASYPATVCWRYVVRRVE